MTRALSAGPASRVIAAVDGGLRVTGCAERFGIAVSSAIRWVRAWRVDGRVTALPQGGDLRSHHIEVLPRRDPWRDRCRCGHHLGRAKRTAPPQAWGRIRAEHGLAFPRPPQLTFKKNAHASEQERPDVAARRRPGSTRSLTSTPKRLVFIDETAVSTKMDRLRGRAPRGQRCRAPIPHGHWKTITFVVALALCGLTAPMVLDGPMNGPLSLPTSNRCSCPP